MRLIVCDRIRNVLMFYVVSRAYTTQHRVPNESERENVQNNTEWGGERMRKTLLDIHTITDTYNICMCPYRESRFEWRFTSLASIQNEIYDFYTSYVNRGANWQKNCNTLYSLFINYIIAVAVAAEMMTVTVCIAL